MRDFPIGVHLGFREANVMLERTRVADAAGLNMVWSTVGGAAPDPLVVFGRAAGETTIGFGTSIVPTYPRHPIVMASQALALEQLAPGRLRLGIGPSHKAVIEGMFGLGFERPLAHLREYVGILRALLHEGSVKVQGEQLSAQARIDAPAPVPILVAALRPRAYRLAGELSDGAISWMSPLPYLRDQAGPAIAAGARTGGRAAPPLIAHVPVVVSEDRESVRAAFASAFGNYQRMPFYEQMMLEAGLEDARGDVLTETMADALVISGDENAVAERVQGLPSFGVGELLADIVDTGETGGRDRARTLELLGALAKDG
ncbi:MAG: Flavin-dependent oxidoreductase, luciferase family [Chloroflexi bacterium]|nr:MAG: Flavin-dependent oxidoreductase, luciferase family [Chloroflexota bacterium]